MVKLLSVLVDRVVDQRLEVPAQSDTQNVGKVQSLPCSIIPRIRLTWHPGDKCPVSFIPAYFHEFSTVRVLQECRIAWFGHHADVVVPIRVMTYSVVAQSVVGILVLVSEVLSDVEAVDKYRRSTRSGGMMHELHE